MICPNCHTELITFMEVSISFPLGHTTKITKEVLRHKEVQIVAVDWPKRRVYCKCGELLQHNKTNDTVSGE